MGEKWRLPLWAAAATKDMEFAATQRSAIILLEEGIAFFQKLKPGHEARFFSFRHLLVLYQILHYLHGIAGSSLSYLVAAAAERQPFLIAEILTYPPYPDQILIAGIQGSRIIAALVVLYQAAAWEGGNGLFCILHGDLILSPYRDCN